MFLLWESAVEFILYNPIYIIPPSVTHVASYNVIILFDLCTKLFADHTGVCFQYVK